jgi:hypothetical protein
MVVPGCEMAISLLENGSPEVDASPTLIPELLESTFHATLSIPCKQTSGKPKPNF